MKSKYILLIILILLVIPSFWFLIKPGFITTDDGNWMIIRFSAFYQALRDGQFPVRVLDRLNFGYGYPVTNFLYPGFMYLAVPFKAFGLSFVMTIKLVIALCMIGSGVFMYLWLGRLYNSVSAFFASLFYVYAPYHLYDLSRRGSVGELLSLAVFPFTMWQIERQSLFFSAIGFALLIISHNTLAIMFLALIISYAAVSIYASENRKLLMEFYSRLIIFGLGISAFFWLPALFELQNTAFSKTKISDFSKYFADYNLIGLTTILIFVGTIIVFIIKTSLIKKEYKTILMLTLGIVTAFLASNLSEVLWHVLPVSFIQFPFRMLSVTIIAASFVLAFCLSQVEMRIRIAVGIVFIAVTIVLSYKLLIPTSFNLEQDGFYSTNEATTTVLDEYMPVWVKDKPLGHFEEKVKVIQGEGGIQNVSANSKNISFNFVSNSPAVVSVSTIYYPGWKAYANGKEKAIFFDNRNGLIELKLEGRNQKVELNFGETTMRLLADIVSILSLILLFTITLYKPVLKYINK